MKGRMPMMLKRWALLTCMLLVAMPALCAPQAEKRRHWKANARQQAILSSETFLSDHPDMLNRLRAMQALDKGDFVSAANYFRRSAHYADKQSQAAYAEMLWKGQGVPQDRAEAYAWMDLAAERGYPLFLSFREKYWDALDEEERRRAVEVGQQVYAEYGDDVAKPRMYKILRRALRKVTGSRTGFVGRLTIIIPGVGTFDGNTYYNKRFWEPKQYWEWQEEVVAGAREGKVIVGDLKQTKDEAKPDPED